MPDSRHVSIIKPGVAIMGMACACSIVELLAPALQCLSYFLESAGSLTRLSTVNITLKDCRAIYKPQL